MHLTWQEFLDVSRHGAASCLRVSRSHHAVGRADNRVPFGTVDGAGHAGLSLKELLNGYFKELGVQLVRARAEERRQDSKARLQYLGVARAHHSDHVSEYGLHNIGWKRRQHSMEKVQDVGRRGLFSQLLAAEPGRDWVRRVGFHSAANNRGNGGLCGFANLQKCHTPCENANRHRQQSAAAIRCQYLQLYLWTRVDGERQERAVDLCRAGRLPTVCIVCDNQRAEARECGLDERLRPRLCVRCEYTKKDSSRV
jgi:hypothetical protein